MKITPSMNLRRSRIKKLLDLDVLIFKSMITGFEIFFSAIATGLLVTIIFPIFLQIILVFISLGILFLAKVCGKIKITPSVLAIMMFVFLFEAFVPIAVFVPLISIFAFWFIK